MAQKIFAYNVGNTEYRDSEPWGEAWKRAKAQAIETHAPIYRQVIKGDNEERWEVFLTGGIFQNVKWVTDNADIKVF